MIVIVAGHDAASTIRRWLAAWPDVYLLRPRDLGQVGWVHDPHSPEDDTVVIDGHPRPAAELTGVVTALDEVWPGELPDVHIDDQQFAAQEVTAFLRSWLGNLPCPVFGRPTPVALSGPARAPETWSRAARRLAVADRRWVTTAGDPHWSVTVVDGRAVYAESAGLAPVAVGLCAAAGVDAAQLTFGRHGNGIALLRADPWWMRPSRAAVAATLRAVYRAADARTSTGEAVRHDPLVGVA